MLSLVGGYTIDNRKLQINKIKLQNIERLEIKQERILEKVHEFEENHDEILKNIFTLEEKIDSLLESK